MKCRHSGPSAAATFILGAAHRIQELPPDGIMERLEHESIRFVWQLEYFDSYQWESMGVPIGLVASIRRDLEEWKNGNKEEPEPESLRPNALGDSRLERASQKLLSLPQELLIESSQKSREVSGTTLPSISMGKRSQSPPAAFFRNESSTQSFKFSILSESVDTYFPPSMPERRQSQPRLSSSSSCLNEYKECDRSEVFRATRAEDHWAIKSDTALDDSIRLPPIPPTRVASCEPALAEAREAER